MLVGDFARTSDPAARVEPERRRLEGQRVGRQAAKWLAEPFPFVRVDVGLAENAP